MPPRRPSETSATAHVFVDALDDECVVSGPDGHHLQRVRRVNAGEHLTAADGTGAWREYDVVAAGAGGLRLAASGPRREEPVFRPTVALAVALTKGGLDTVAARATELGMARLVPVATRRSVVRWDERRADAAVQRLRKIVREAAAQSRRARVPVVDQPVAVAALAGTPGLVIADPAGVHAAELALPPGGEWTVLVGPEGGLAPEDLAPLDGAGAGPVPRVALGPHVLRAETAPLAAVAVLLAVAHSSQFGRRESRSK